MNPPTEIVQRLIDRFDRFEALLKRTGQSSAKDFYTTAEVAKALDKAEFTVREWCRNERMHAKKRACGRGPTKEWMISHAELLRYQNEGLLPAPRVSTKL